MLITGMDPVIEKLFYVFNADHFNINIIIGIVSSALYIVSVPNTPNQAELRTLCNVDRGAQPQVLP